MVEAIKVHLATSVTATMIMMIEEGATITDREVVNSETTVGVIAAEAVRGGMTHRMNSAEAAQGRVATAGAAKTITREEVAVGQEG